MDSGASRITLPSQLTGKYELTRELAVGGMGVIWLARDLVQNRDVVFKFVAEELLGDEETKIRFLNEAKLTKALDHAHIVQLYDTGEDPEKGTLYIIYEYLDGTNLKTLLEKYGQYRIGQALDILIKVSDGIACAHRHKILHRDIKPENILVSPLGDKVKIVDFGIAKSIEDTQKLTQTGFIIGTPEYLSPEQAVGHKATYASDQYALAVLAYEMLTARLPIEDTNTVDLFTKKIRGAWVPIRERRPEIPTDLAKIIEKAMATDAAQRYLTVDDFVKALTDFTSRRSTLGMQRPKTAGATSANAPANPKSQGVARGGSTTRVSTGNIQTLERHARIQAIKKGVAGVAALALLGAVGYGVWSILPARGSGGGLPRMYGTLSTVHQLDGVLLSWDYPAAGSAFARLQPGGAEKPMGTEKGRFVLQLAPGEAKDVSSVDLLVKDGGKVSTEVDGVPFLHVTQSSDTLTVTVPPVAEGAVLAYWPAGQESSKKEVPLKSKGKGFVAEGVPLTSGEDMMLQVFGGSGEPKPALSFLQKVPSVEGYLDQLAERLSRLEALAPLGKAASTDELTKAARKTFDQLRTEAPADAIELLKDPVGSSGVDTGRKLALFEAVQRLDLLRRMATRAGWSGKSAELDALMDLPWPVRVKVTIDKGLPGKKKPAETNVEKKMASTLVQLKTGAIDPAAVKTAVLHMPFLATGNGTFVKVSIAKRATVYVVGPDALPEGIHTQGGAADVEMDAGVLPKGEAEIVVETVPVAALVERALEILVIPVSLKLTVVSPGGSPAPVAVTPQQ